MKALVTISIIIIGTLLKPSAYESHNSEKIIINKNSLAMSNQDYTTDFLVDASPEKVYDAINNVRAWWAEDIEGITDKLNGEWFYHYKDIHLCKMKVVEMKPNKKVVWEVLDNSFNFVEDKTEWIGNRLIFDISKEGERTKVTFTQEGLTPAYDCYKVCNDGWNNYINNSLQQLITTGKGAPNPKDKEGFNAELAERWNIKSKN